MSFVFIYKNFTFRFHAIKTLICNTGSTFNWFKWANISTKQTNRISVFDSRNRSTEYFICLSIRKTALYAQTNTPTCCRCVDNGAFLFSYFLSFQNTRLFILSSTRLPLHKSPVIKETNACVKNVRFARSGVFVFSQFPLFCRNNVCGTFETQFSAVYNTFKNIRL